MGDIVFAFTAVPFGMAVLGIPAMVFLVAVTKINERRRKSAV